MFAGFTAYAATRGDRAAARLVHQHDAAVLPAIRRYSGRILKRLGDGLMAAFSSPGAALDAASGYLKNPMYRTFGLVSTVYPTIVVLVYAAYRITAG